MASEIPDANRIAQEAEVTLAEIERRLLSLIQNGAKGTRELDEVINSLAQLAREIRVPYLRVLEVLDRRDLGFDAIARLEASRKRGVWLYRRSRLERCSFMKLRSERSLRDAISRLIVETCEAMSALDETERELRVRDDESLEMELLQESEAR